MEHTWPKPCLDIFRRLATNEPLELLQWIYSDSLSHAHLSLALEELCLVEDPRCVEVIKERTLYRFVIHRSPIVREGAINAIIHFAPVGANIVMTYLASHDPSPAIRVVAADAMGWIEEKALEEDK